MKTFKASLVTLFLLASAQVFAGSPVLYFNGNILTMEGASPKYVEAVVVEDGKISFAGNKQDAINQAGANITFKDLDGKTLLPGFIDTWGHFTLVAQNALAVNLAYFADNPPRSKEDILTRLGAASPRNGWVVGTGYVSSMVAGGDLTIADLDRAFPNQPVMVVYLSTLAGITNSVGLKRLGITASTVASGGYIVKNLQTGALTGELIGNPFLDSMSKVVGRYSKDVLFKTYRQAEKVYVSNGYTTAQSYQVTPTDIQNMHDATKSGVVSIDLIALPEFMVVDQLLKQNPQYSFGTYSLGNHGMKVAGMLMPTDGAPQLRAAYFTKPYADTTGMSKDWRGFAVSTQDMVDYYAQLAYKKNIQYFGYSAGDAGIDMTLSAIRRAVDKTGVTENRRTMISHSSFARDDQLKQYKDLNIGMYTMPNQIFLYGDTYLEILGKERATAVAPVASAFKYGLVTGLHADAPGDSPSAIDAIHSAVNRITYKGVILGPDERIDPYLALQGFTSNAAYIYREEDFKGTISAGKVADLVILDQNPLTVKPEKIRDIKVLETIKRGKTVFVEN